MTAIPLLALSAGRVQGHVGRGNGRAGARVTIDRQRVAYFNGLMTQRGWNGRRPVALLTVDLVAGQFDAALAAYRRNGLPGILRAALTITAVPQGLAYVAGVSALAPLHFRWLGLRSV